jgi:heptosyltransferase-3
MHITLQPKAIKRILIVHVSGRIGDSLLATPTIVALQQSLPDTQIDLLAHKKWLALFDNIQGISVLGSISKKRACMRGWFTLRKYDYVIIFNYCEPLQQILHYGMRVGRRVIAFQVPEEKINNKLFYCIPHIPFYEKSSHNNEHIVEAYLKLIIPLGVYAADRRINFYLRESERKEAEAILKNSGLEQKYLVGYKITSLASRSYRDWPIDNFIELSKRIMKLKPNAHFILFGGDDERSKIDQVISSLGKAHSVYFPGLSIRLTGAIMSRIDLYVGVDTGPTHLMSAFDIPFVGLYHCKNPSKYIGPLDHPNAILIDHPLGTDCSESSSMSDISIDDVFSQIEKLINHI